MDNNKFTAKNFRIFDETGTSFIFKPITLLTGQNGSGKSSLTKAIMLMHDFFTSTNQNKEDFNPSSIELDFTRPSLKLGGFNVEKNYHSSSDVMSFQYSVRPKVAAYLSFDVEYFFKSTNDDDSLYNNGLFDRLTIRHQDKTLVSINHEDFTRSQLFDISYSAFTISFIVFCIGMNLQWIYTSEEKCKDSNGIIIDVDGFNNLEKAKDSFLRIAEKLPTPFTDALLDFNQKLSHSALSFQKDLLLELTSKNSSILSPEIVIELDGLLEEHSFFHFEVFKELDRQSKEEVVDILQKLNYHNSSCASKDVITGFLNSEYSLISDYFRSLEDEMFHNMSALDFDYAFKNNIFEVYPKYSFGEYEGFAKHIPDFLSIKYCSSIKEPLCKFQWLYDCLYLLEVNKTSTSSKHHIITWEAINPYSPHESVSSYGTHRLYSSFTEYLSLLFRDVLNPEWLNQIYYFGDAHTNVQRIHSLSDKNDIVVSRVTDYLRTTKKGFTMELPEELKNHEKPFIHDIEDLMERMFSSIEDKTLLSKEQYDKYSQSSFVDYWISELGIGEKVQIELDKDKMSITLSIVKDSQNNKTVLLADEGYGIYQIVLLLLSIETELEKINKVFNSNTDSLFGSHSLRTIILEEPEANLHPAFQTKIAQILYNAYVLSGGHLHFIVETHSEYLIRATQAIVAKTVNDEADLKEVPFIVYYIENGGKAYDMEYQVSGRFNKPFGTGFFDEAGKSSLEIIRKERRMADGKDA